MLLLAVVLVFQCLMMGQVLLGFPLNKSAMLNNRNALSARFVMITVKSVFHLCDSSRNLLLAAGTPIPFYLTDTGYLLRCCYYYRTAWQHMVRKHRGKAEILKFYPKKWNEIIVHNLHTNKLDVCKYRILRDLSRELEGKTLLQHIAICFMPRIFISSKVRKNENIYHMRAN